MKKSKKIFLIIFLGSFLFLASGTFLFAQKTEVDYPQVPGAETPRSVKTFLPKYIQYLFNLSLLIAGLIAFASLVYGGFRYLASAGSPVAMSDAKSQITAGILGLIILLASFLVLRTINPQLTVVQIKTGEFEKGVILYEGNCEGSNPTGEEGKNFLRVRRSMASLSEFNEKTQNIYFYNSGDEMEVYLYYGESYNENMDNSDWKSVNHDAGICLPAIEAKSIVLRWNVPGVYLYETPDCNASTGSHPEPRLFVGDSGDFGDFHDKAKSLRILPQIKTESQWIVAKCPGVSIPGNVCLSRPDCCEPVQTVISKFGAILHEHSDFEGDAEVHFGGEYDDTSPLCVPLINTDTVCENNFDNNIDGPGPYCQEHVQWQSSAIHLFKQFNPLIHQVKGDGVTLYSNYDWNEEGENPVECGPYNDPEPQWITSGDCSVLGGMASSIRVNGTFIALLFRNDGRGELFKAPGDIRLKDNHIGDDEARFMLVVPVSPEK